MSYSEDVFIDKAFQGQFPRILMTSVMGNCRSRVLTGCLPSGYDVAKTLESGAQAVIL